MSKAMVMVSGYLAGPAELKQVGEDQVAEFSIAHNRKERGEEVTDWYRINVWGKRATAIAPFLTKGKYVAVVGEQSVRAYLKDGQARVSIDVRVSEIDLGPGTDRDQEAPRQAAPAPAARPAPAPAPVPAPTYHPPGTSPGAGATHQLVAGAWVPLATPVAPPPPPANGNAAPVQYQRGAPF